MIKKFKEIKNLAVFQNFEWDESVLNKDGNVLEFKQINILYGRNYSGKTTLSRILRAIETGTISDKFENPSFNVAFADNFEINQDGIVGHGKKVRVFNDDFVRENLKFIINPDENIEPFAILGIDNNRIEGEIKALELLVGSNKEGEETGLHVQLKQENEKVIAETASHNSRSEQLNSQLNSKATNRYVGIKYKAEKFGDQNYTIRRLETDIQTVLATTFKPISNAEQTDLEKLIQERINNPIPAPPTITLNINRFNSAADTLITKPVGASDKIQELTKDAILNKWVKEGKHLHKDKREKCAFCDNTISESRWTELEKHFDEESEKLEIALDKLIEEVAAEIISCGRLFKPNKNLFYSKFQPKVERINIAFNYAIEKNAEQLENLNKQLTARKNDIINPKTFNEESNYIKRIEWIISIYEKLLSDANNYSSQLSTDQGKAKDSLRLREVSDFVTTIKYSDEVTAIADLKVKVDTAKEKRDKVDFEIADKNKEIESKRRELKDESKGADKVNEYLNNFFGHEFLSLKAEVIIVEGDTPVKKYRFEVIRDKKKAYHLSEGECSLIAFCYFMAKLEDIETKGSKPIIWIDDPISSLDSNHIFFVYSLINSEIVAKQDFEQLFVSTHNLDFLKYLKRLPAAAANNLQRGYFIVSREYHISKIKLMPKYLKDYVTEFNFLFHQIYLCANADADDETQHSIFYNFGNNTRKFLEAFLFYKYPNANDKDDKLTRFFGENRQASSMTDRINNEFSHLEGLFERSMIPIDIPEMKKTATFILDKIREKDNDQYEALLISIGVEITE